VFLPLSLYATETRLKIAILDTGIAPDTLKEYYCKDGSKDYTYTSLTDDHGHGTNIASIIVKDLDPTKVCIQVMKIFYEKTKQISWFYEEMQNLNIGFTMAHFNLHIYKKALIDLVTNKPDIVNMSYSGGTTIGLEEKTIRELLNNNTKVFIAAGNEGLNLNEKCDTYPACYKKRIKHPNLHIIGNYSKHSNYGNKIVTTVVNGNNKCYKHICMSGTSQASAVAVNEYVKNNP